MDGRAATGPVAVVWTRVEPGAEASTDLLAQLGAAQLARHRLLEGAAAARFATGRRLLAELIREIAGADAELELMTACERCGREHGRVRQSAGRVVLSVAYAGDLVVAAGADARAAVAVGVDVERDDGVGAERVAELSRLFAPQPAPSLAAWTRIEAVLKADGRGLRVDPAAVRFRGDGERIRANVPGDPRVWDVATIPGPSGYLVTVACGRRAESAP